MKKLFHILFFVCCTGAQFFFVTSCKKAEDIKASDIKPQKELTDNNGNANTNRIKLVHLYKDTVYTLSENFVRQDGEQLIIDEGTIIKINAGGSPIAITINPGGIIQAIGTRTNPIVFTSNSYQGNQNVNWGGIVIQGRASDNAVNANGDPADFSGTLNFVRIEFAPLVLTAVGNRTVVENVMVSYVSAQSQTRAASSFEIDGGNFNARNLVSYACAGPSDFYITRGYSGKMQNLLAYRHPFFGSAGNNVPANALSGVFIENNPADPAGMPNTYPIISNLTVIGPNRLDGSSSSYEDTTLRSAALVTTGNAFFRIRNSLLLGFPLGAWFLDDSLTAHSIQYNQSELTYSIVHSNDSTRLFYLKPGTYFSFTSADFKNFMLGSPFNNEVFASADDFKFTDPFNYDHPNPIPLESSPVLTGANFDGADVFFNKVTYKGALGKDNWLDGWTNFTPLKTNYNFEH